MTPGKETNPQAPLLIAVTGGIGSGKSVVCRVLSALGYPVYDCDSRAKEIMDSSDEIKSVISGEISEEAVNPDGSINRPALADAVFGDPAKLAILDRAVHSAVTSDIRAWRASYADADLGDGKSQPLLFVETAIPFKSGLFRMVDDIWEVTASEEIRIARAAARDKVSAESVRRRIASQAAESPSVRAAAEPDSAPGFRTLLNDGSTPLLPAIQRLLSGYGRQA